MTIQEAQLVAALKATARWILSGDDPPPGPDMPVGTLCWCDETPCFRYRRVPAMAASLEWRDAACRAATEALLSVGEAPVQ